MYHLFAGDDYYPDRGLGDYVWSYDDLNKAEAEGRSLIKDRKDWFSVITESDGRLVEVNYEWRR
jgi:hypothetical protein